METNKKHIVILGGGSSGWMTASYLSRYRTFKSNLDLKITLVEAPGIAPIGVGEATIPHIKRFLRALDFDKEEWLSLCNGTIKLGIRFSNFAGRENHESWGYTFQADSNKVKGYRPIECWVLEYMREGKEPFPQTFVLADYLMKKKKGPQRLKDGEADSEVLPYAYHIDAALHGRFCKKFAIENGVVHIEDEVEGSSLDSDGGISCLHTKEHGDIYGDLFVDCSGFRSELLGKKLKEPFISYGDSLLCDSAAVLHVPREGRGGNFSSFSDARGLSSGWMWEIPLLDKTSYGYVYSSAFLDKDGAEKELRKKVGKGARERDAFHISFRTGRSRNCWVKNCVAIGLSGGFIEPLESTGLYLTQHGIECLVNFLSFERPDQSKVEEYNRVMGSAYDEIRDFIVMHYCITNREDTPFWKACKYDLKLPQSVKDIRSKWNQGWLFGSKMSYLYDRDFTIAFGLNGYLRLFTGMGYLPESLPGSVYTVSSQDALTKIKRYQEALDRESDTYDDHLAYLSYYRRVQIEKGLIKEAKGEGRYRKENYSVLFSMENFTKKAEEANKWLQHAKEKGIKVPHIEKPQEDLYSFEGAEHKKSSKYTVFFKCPKANFGEKLDVGKERVALKEAAERVARKEVVSYSFSRFFDYPVIAPCSFASFEVEGQELFGVGQLYVSGGFKGSTLMELPLQQRSDFVKSIEKGIFDKAVVLSALLMNCDVNMGSVYFFVDGHMVLLDNQKAMPESNEYGTVGGTYRNCLLAFPQAEGEMDSELLRSISRWDHKSLTNFVKGQYPEDTQESRGIIESFQSRMKDIMGICERAIAEGESLTPRDLVFRLLPDYQKGWEILKGKGYPSIALSSMSAHSISELSKLEAYDSKQQYSDDTGMNYESPPFLTVEESESFQKAKLL